MVYDVWSWKGLFFMADFSVFLLDPFVDLPVTRQVAEGDSFVSCDGVYCYGRCCFIRYFEFNDT